MTVRVNSNIPAINSHRNLLINNTEQAKVMERLSSGLKINRGADGPAALVISERLRSQTAGLEQAIDNSEAGISLVQTAEAALDEVSASLINARQLEVHAANEAVNDEFMLRANQQEIENIKELIKSNKNGEAILLLDECKNLIEEYADSYSRNQNIKKDSIKRSQRIKTIETEIESWKNLTINSEKMVNELEERKIKFNDKLEEFESQPQSQAEKKGKISENLRISEQEKSANELKISDLDEKISELRKNLNFTKESSIEIRERKASSGATVEGLNKRRQDLLDRVQDELSLNESELLNYSNLEKEDEFPDALTQEELLDEKKRQRDKLGSVNLRADEETSKYEDEIKKMEKDRQDLVSAIIKLKESINELNQKGRERLLNAFEKVNRKFNEVYTKLFNGGNAKLELVDSDDPLDAGLEMLVSPPGKRLQSITLLSGGEQALTALSLIFAVFLTNPSPICVLDEVDAPLDDANVTRFCNLLDELTKITSTRFIIVTHHALTMSKMDRLYGVTMPEKGISQLVAVDLQKAESMVA